MSGVSQKKPKSKKDTGGTGAQKPLSRISVRTLVEFLLRSGDIDTRDGHGAPDPEAALLGGKLHRKLQKAQKSPDYEAEVSLAEDMEYEDLVIRVEGRADGVIHHGGEVTIEEIKGMYLDVTALEEPFPVHLAQAKCYAYMLSLRENLPEVQVRMTYANLETEESRIFLSAWKRDDLAAFFKSLTDRWHVWAKWQIEHCASRDESMKHLTFPFPYREGQKRLTAAVYHTISEKQQLFLMAPTGVGKTMSCVYPSVRAIGEGEAERIFYLTAKNETLAAGREAFAILEQNGLDFRTVQITSKEKICPYDEPRCNPDDCPYAKGHFDRVNEAVLELLQSGKHFGREELLAQSRRRTVCPFELTLDVASWCDAILCDYNYVFDPNARLARFFGNGNRGRYIFLIDEAHNLVDRGREMYSASLVKEHVLAAKRVLGGGKRKNAAAKKGGDAAWKEDADAAWKKGGDAAWKEDAGAAWKEGGDAAGKENQGGAAKKDENRDGEAEAVPRVDNRLSGPEKRRVIRALEGMNRRLLELKHRLEDASQGTVMQHPYLLLPFSEAEPYMHAALSLFGALEDFYKESKDAEAKEALLDFYFEVMEFVNVCDYLDEHYVLYASEREGEERGKTECALTLFCVNPAARITKSIGENSSAVFFSATLLPLSFYKTLLSTREKPYAVYARSSFSKEKRKILIAGDVSTLYKTRGEHMYRKIAAYIRMTAESKTGNYIAFFPSYSMLKSVFEIYRREFDAPGVNWVLQNPHMREEDREIFMENFYEDPEESLVGFCVMGGMFSEGIDLTGTRLIGAIVVGAGLPQLGVERELIRRYFDGELTGAVRKEKKPGTAAKNGPEEQENSSGQNGESRLGGQAGRSDQNGQAGQSGPAGQSRWNRPGSAGDGFDYAYRYPGMNKVEQAAGRVIRTEHDRGVILLLDSRLLESSYRRIFPEEWGDAQACSLDTAASDLADFWNGLTDDQ